MRYIIDNKWIMPHKDINTDVCNQILIQMSYVSDTSTPPNPHHPHARRPHPCTPVGPHRHPESGRAFSKVCRSETHQGCITVKERDEPEKGMVSNGMDKLK